MYDEISLLKRFSACLYELLSLAAIWILCTAAFLYFFNDTDTAFKRHSLQLFLWVITGTYFISCWVRTGQTLAAQTWKIRVVDLEGKTLSTPKSALRYVLAFISLVPFLGFGFLWALVDKERCFLHDRILKTRLMKADESAVN